MCMNECKTKTLIKASKETKLCSHDNTIEYKLVTHGLKK